MTRLLQAQQFHAVFAQPTRFNVGGYAILARRNSNGYPRLGLAISKRYARRAVDRNRLKRLARESFRIAATSIPAVDIVVLCERKATTTPNYMLFSALERAWDHIRAASWENS
jgi:ribonuclease P protein component